MNKTKRQHFLIVLLHSKVANTKKSISCITNIYIAIWFFDRTRHCNKTISLNLSSQRKLETASQELRGKYFKEILRTKFRYTGNLFIPLWSIVFYIWKMHECQNSCTVANLRFFQILSIFVRILCNSNFSLGLNTWKKPNVKFLWEVEWQS